MASVRQASVASASLLRTRGTDRAMAHQRTLNQDRVGDLALVIQRDDDGAARDALESFAAAADQVFEMLGVAS